MCSWFCEEKEQNQGLEIRIGVIRFLLATVIRFMANMFFFFSLLFLPRWLMSEVSLSPETQ